ncbi:MAG: copper-translocating P-type ATPase [marine bacterium B5-7]|nr:MAG: copper-translocating P-type ATPase [marine bacterium B5-7]
MCCYGCSAVAEQIIEFGLVSYYQHRTQLPQKPDEIVPDDLKKLAIFNNPQIQTEFVSVNDDTTKEARLIIEGINCPACVWLIESRLSSLAGVKQVSVNYSTQRTRVCWQESETSLSDILAAISKLGYSAQPYNHKQRELIFDNERKSQLMRLGIAGLFGMQVMMIAVALYFGDVSGIDHQYRIFFHWLSFILTLPVLVYSGRPLFIGALRDIKNKRLGMDVPIVLGLSIAFCSSLLATIQNNGHVFYDSIVMFIFFILGGRYFEFLSRRKSTAYLDKVSSILPLSALRILGQGEHEVVELNQLAVADKVLIKPGEVIPIDGDIYEGCSSVNESLITGESMPVTKNIGMHVIGGSTNIESPLYIKVTHVGEHTILSNIARIIDKASSNKPASVLLANKIVSVFITCLLVIAGLVAGYWYHVDQSQWLAITITVLVVSCPCALSLATPTAFSSAAATLMQHGIALINNDAIEKISKSNCFVFDKTGTLTKGELELVKIDVLHPDFNEVDVLRIAAALESASEHPLAKAILSAAKNLERYYAHNIKNHPGQGLSGESEQVWFIGTERFINSHCTGSTSRLQDSPEPLRKIVLANSESIIALFYFHDELRDNSQVLIDFLQKQHKKVVLMSGDHASIVSEVAEKLGVDEYQSELKPEDKLNNIAKLQGLGFQICMVGDGINDAPAFAQSDIAIAMTSASDITKLNADMLLLNNKIESLIKMLKIVHKTNRTVHTNFTWALTYNIIALPFAIAGFITPWMAALGMSLSSLIVVVNATKISTTKYS